MSPDTVCVRTLTEAFIPSSMSGERSKDTVTVNLLLPPLDSPTAPMPVTFPAKVFPGRASTVISASIPSAYFRMSSSSTGKDTCMLLSGTREAITVPSRS